MVAHQDPGIGDRGVLDEIVEVFTERDDAVTHGCAVDELGCEMRGDQRAWDERTSELLEDDHRFRHPEAGAALVLRQPQREDAGVAERPPAAMVEPLADAIEGEPPEQAALRRIMDSLAREGCL